MKIGFFSDVHGNYDALVNCLSYFGAQKIDNLFFLGDVIGYLPKAKESFALINKRHISSLRGNHEQMILGLLPKKEGNEEYYKHNDALPTFSELDLDVIAQWPTHLEVTFGKYNCLLIHGSPKDYSNGYVYPDTDLDEFGDLPYSHVFMGHTHRPFVKKHANTTFVNVGSVGLPRDIGNLSNIAIFNTIDGSVEQIKIPITEEQIQEIKLNNNIHTTVKAVFDRK